MKKKWVKIIFIFFIISSVFTQEGEKDKETITIPSYQKNQEILKKNRKNEFENRFKIALELKNINAEIAIQRIYEILLHYTEFLNEEKTLETLLTNLYELSKKNKKYEYISNFYLLLDELEKQNLLKNSLKEKFQSNLQ